MQGPGADGIRIVGQLDPGTGVRNPVVDGQFVLVPTPLRLGVPETQAGIARQGPELQGRRDQPGRGTRPVFLVEKGVVTAVSRRGFIETPGVLDPVGGPGDELFGPDIGVVGRGAPRPGAVEIFEIRNAHRGRRRRGLGRRETGENLKTGGRHQDQQRDPAFQGQPPMLPGPSGIVLYQYNPWSAGVNSDTAPRYPIETPATAPASPRPASRTCAGRIGRGPEAGSAGRRLRRR